MSLSFCLTSQHEVLLQLAHCPHFLPCFPVPGPFFILTYTPCASCLPVSFRFLLQKSTQASSLLKSHLEHCSSLFPLTIPTKLLNTVLMHFTETYECFAMICKILYDLASAHFSFLNFLQQNG